MNLEYRISHGERGQTTLIVVLVLGLFLFGFIALAVDFSNLWFHRQTAQSAADSACVAAGADMLAHANSITTTLDGFIPPAGAASGFDCSGNMSLAPCQYARINKVDATGGLQTNAESKEVHISFPSSIDGVVTDPGVTNIAGPNPYVRATVTDRTRVFFASLFTGNPTQDVRATAACGLVLQKAPIPLIVLNPHCGHSFEVSGSATLKIVGGPIKSVQVNSDNQTCAAATTATANQCTSNGTVDLSQGGPTFDGSAFGVTGAPGSAPPNFTGSQWSNALPIADPFANTPAPTGVPDAPPVTKNVPYTVHGCPDHSGCYYYQPGVYHAPIVVSGVTAIFAPGVYVIKPDSYTGFDATGDENHGAASGGGLCGSPSTACVAKPTGQCTADFIVSSGGVVRPANDGDPKAGFMFYLSGTAAGYGSAAFINNAGISSHTVDPFLTDNLVCPGGTAPDPRLGIPSQVDGNVLMGQCTAKGTYLGFGSGDAAGHARGLLFFQDHSNGNVAAQMNLQGNGSYALAGTLYAHAANDDAFIQLQGTPGSGTYLFGEIVTDQFILSGNGDVAMQLSTEATLDVLKVQLLQ
jgi:hypothetical protein